MSKKILLPLPDLHTLQLHRCNRATLLGPGHRRRCAFLFSVGHPRVLKLGFFRTTRGSCDVSAWHFSGLLTDTHIDIKLRVKLGPIVPEFEGGAYVGRVSANHTGMIWQRT